MIAVPPTVCRARNPPTSRVPASPAIIRGPKLGASHRKAAREMGGKHRDMVPQGPKASAARYVELGAKVVLMLPAGRGREEERRSEKS